MTVEELEAIEIDWTQGVSENFQRVKSAALAALEAANRRADEAEARMYINQRIAIAAEAEIDTLRARVAEYETERDTLREAGRYMLRIVDVIRKETKRRSDERYSLRVPETAAILSEDDARAALKGASHEQG